MTWRLRPRRALPVLLHLEWILLSIATIASISPWSLRPRLLRSLPPGFIRLSGLPFPLMISLGTLLCIALLGMLGQRLPAAVAVAPDPTPLGSSPSPPRAEASGLIGAKLLYGGLGFGLAWLAILLGGRGATVFPPLLLTVVIRCCLLFPGWGRWGSALTAFGSFVLMQALALMHWRPFGVELMRLPLPRQPERRLPPELVEGIIWNAVLNASLLFGLVLAFVLMMVGTLLSEKESRDRLALANQKLRRYALLAEDQATLQERNRIAREMHDSVGHALTAQSIQLENVARLLRHDLDQAERRLQQARQLGKEALRNVRQSVASLRSHPLQNQPLEVALKQLVEEFQQNTHIPVQWQGEINNVLNELSADLKTALYRVVQEGLTNITKHSQAHQVTLTLHHSPQGLQLNLSDDGVGFDPSQNTTGFGLQSMAERIRAIGGRFLLTSEPGAGCQVQIEIPPVILLSRRENA